MLSFVQDFYVVRHLSYQFVNYLIKNILFGIFLNLAFMCAMCAQANVIC